MGAEVFQPGLAAAHGAIGIREGDVGVADIDRVQERLAMEKRGVIDIKREFADNGEERGRILEIVNAHILRDEAAEGIEGETTDGGFDAALAQLVRDGGAPLAAETFVRQIPTSEKKQR